MPGPLDEIAQFTARQYEEQLRQREARDAEIHQERRAEVRSILRRLSSCCKNLGFRWPEKRMSTSAISKSGDCNSVALLIVENRLRRGLAHFDLCAHFLDLCSLLSELSCESLYLFLLLCDRCLQLLNFVIEHGLALEARAR